MRVLTVLPSAGQNNHDNEKVVKLYHAWDDEQLDWYNFTNHKWGGKQWRIYQFFACIWLRYQFSIQLHHTACLQIFQQGLNCEEFLMGTLPLWTFPMFFMDTLFEKKKLTALEKMHGHNCLSNKSFAIIEVWREKNVLKIQILPANCFSIPNLPAN